MSTRYEFRVEGHLDQHWARVLDGFSLRHAADGTTTLTGPVLDQSQLHGHLSRLRDVGASLLSLRAVPGQAGQPGQPGAGGGPLARLDWPRATERLELRPARVEDARATWRFRRLESVSRWLTAAPAGFDSYRRTFGDPARLATTLVVERDGRVIGDLLLRVQDAWAQQEVRDQARQTQAEIGWVLDPDFAGHGLGTEAVRELGRICFAELGIRRVVATCFADNAPSWRLMERVGMRRELHGVGDALHRSAGWSDTFSYAALAGEWDA